MCPCPSVIPGIMTTMLHTSKSYVRTAYAHQNVCWVSDFLKMLKDKNLTEKHRWAKMALSQTLTRVQDGVTNLPNFKPGYVIRVLKFDTNNMRYRSEQNIGLHDICSPEAMKRKDTCKSYSLLEGTSKAHMDH